MSTIPQVSGRLRELRARAHYGVQAAALAMSLDFAAEVKKNELSRYSHDPGTATPSPPGEPPALISGALRREVRPVPVLPAERYRMRVLVGSTVVYARIQELGGWAGRGHASYLPPRPYLKPAAERVIGSRQAGRAAVRGWTSVMGR
jgi:hypothetical protein